MHAMNMKSIIALLVFLFALVVYYQEDNAVLFLTERSAGVNGHVFSQTSHSSNNGIDNSHGNDNRGNDNTTVISHEIIEDESSLRNSYWNSLINAAEISNYTCSNDTLPTSIHATLLANNDSSSIDVRVISHRAKDNNNESSSPFISINLAFYAYDETMRPQRSGGDLFVVDYQISWPSTTSSDDSNIETENSNGYTVFKSSVFTHDHLDGRYSATMLLPRKVLLVSKQQHQKADNDVDMQISLRHYYTCHEGFKLTNRLEEKGDGYHVLKSFGPLPWKKVRENIQSTLKSLLHEHASDHARLISAKADNNMSSSFSMNDDNALPKCSDDPNNEYILSGAWVDESLDKPMDIMNMSVDATWTPFHCTLDGDPRDNQRQPKGSATANNKKHYRIGDSTMPGTIIKSFHHEDVIEHKGSRPGIKLKFGIPYTPYLSDKLKKDHDGFLDVLQAFTMEYNNNQSDTLNPTNDTFLYSGGLHHLLWGNYNVRATATLVLRTLCQVGLTFPGAILLRGPNPLQQHQYHVVDITSMHVRWLNWELQSQLRNYDHGLADLCLSMPAEDVASFVALPDENGSLIEDEKADSVLLQKYNYSWNENSTSYHKEMSNWIRTMTQKERRKRYGERKIGWINLEGFLLSRPEVYRKYDKIHDSLFFFGPEWNLLSIIEEGYA